MLKTKIVFWMLLGVMCIIISPSGANAQRRSPKAKLGKICGNPQLKCRTPEIDFPAHEIPFELPTDNAVIYESESFYMVVLKTVKYNVKVNCDNAISENERLEIQKVFLDHKVFALKCSDAGDLSYTNVADNVGFIAVYAGKTAAQANSFLKTVQATGKFKGANLRKTQAMVNGT